MFSSQRNGTGRATQVVEHLLCKCEALSLNLSQKKKKVSLRHAHKEMIHA
jgi:hypothetical protein